MALAAFHTGKSIIYDYEAGEIFQRSDEHKVALSSVPGWTTIPSKSSAPSSSACLRLLKTISILSIFATSQSCIGESIVAHQTHNLHLAPRRVEPERVQNQQLRNKPWPIEGLANFRKRSHVGNFVVD
jgi:hypothetical protein